MKINTHRSLLFVKEALKEFPSSVSTLQTDHGPEFSTWFTKQVQVLGIAHRHLRVRKPSDNGYSISKFLIRI